MRKGALLFAVLLAASVSTNAYAKQRHHHWHHGHHWVKPDENKMKLLAFVATASIFAPVPIGIWATSTADRAAARVLRYQRRHHKR